MELNSSKPINENKQVTVPLKDVQSLQKTVNELSKTHLRYDPLLVYSDTQSIKKPLKIQKWGYQKPSI